MAPSRHRLWTIIVWRNHREKLNVRSPNLSHLCYGPPRCQRRQGLWNRHRPTRQAPAHNLGGCPACHLLRAILNVSKTMLLRKSVFKWQDVASTSELRSTRRLPGRWRRQTLCAILSSGAGQRGRQVASTGRQHRRQLRRPVLLHSASTLAHKSNLLCC